MCNNFDGLTQLRSRKRNCIYHCIANDGNINFVRLVEFRERYC